MPLFSQTSIWKYILDPTAQEMNEQRRSSISGNEAEWLGHWWQHSLDVILLFIILFPSKNES